MINELLNKSGHCIKELILKKKNIFLYEKIINFNLNDLPWNQKVYNYINKIVEIPKCSCKNELNFISFKDGYRKYCSIKCATNSIEFKIKKENTTFNIYGVKNISQSPIIKEKKEKTLLENYGVTHPLKSSVIKKRVISTNNNHWGVDNISQSSFIAEKKRLTTQENYSVNYNFQSREIKKNINKTIKKKYGVDYYVQSIENKLCIKNSINLKRVKFWAKHLKINNSDITITGNTIIIKNLCKIHKQFEINKYNLYNRSLIYQIENICTKCNPISENSSIKENEIRDFIEDDLNFITEKIRINNKEIDVYLPNNKLGIEFDGLYWHSNIHKDKNYHLNKTEECEEQGIQLLHVFEDEWIYKKEIVKSIIKSKLGIINTKIFARKTEIRELFDNKLVRNFLETNHIQGFVGSKVKIGLFYNNKLVSIMTFGKKRLSMGNKTIVEGEYEMFRFCNKLNTTVIGGASKLLNYFIKIYHPKSIISFADRRYSNGRLYENLGFEFIDNTKPNYWYFKTSEMVRHYRFKFRKDVLIKEGYDSNKTEHQIMLKRGYLKIYDCGNMKFIKTL